LSERTCRQPMAKTRTVTGIMHAAWRALDRASGTRAADRPDRACGTRWCRVPESRDDDAAGAHSGIAATHRDTATILFPRSPMPAIRPRWENTNA
jgi:hypothetical protein